MRLPGGRISAGALGAVTAAAQRYANGDVQLTSRGNLQLRGVATDARGAVAAGLVDAVVTAGLLPQPSHERVRNIVCSPCTGLLGGVADLRGLTRLLDEKLCAAGQLADLPGPFLMVLDDGSGDVVGLKADLGACAITADRVRLRVGALLVGPPMTHDEAANALIELATRFLPSTRAEGRTPPVWHVRELPLGGRELLPASWKVDPAPAGSRQPAPLGRLTQDDGQALLSVLVPLAVLTAAQATAVIEAARSGAGELIVTPWRTVLIPGMAPSRADQVASRLAEGGLELSANSPWRGITACTGAPRCAHGVGETRALAGSLADIRRTMLGPAAPVHVVGCERRCGSPTGLHTELLNVGAVVQISQGGNVVEVPRAAAAAAGARQ
jgi:precorrin-3B synthase